VVSHGRECSVLAGIAGSIMAGLVQARNGMAGFVGRGKVGNVSHVMAGGARLVAARFGLFLLGSAWQARLGQARSVESRKGLKRHGRQGKSRASRSGGAWFVS